MLIHESVVELATPSGPMRTYVQRPAAVGRYPGVIFFSEIFQRTGPIARMAAILAGHGYVVATPEIFHELEPAGTVIPYDQAERGNAHKLTKPLAAFDADAAAVRTWLGHQGCPAVGAFGVCIGGHLAWRAALDPHVKAAVCVYPTDIHKTESVTRAGDLRAAMLMIWGRQDPHIPVAGREAIRHALDEAGTRFTWHEFNAQHAFLRDDNPRYDAALALTVYRLALDHLGEILHA